MKKKTLHIIGVSSFMLVGGQVVIDNLFYSNIINRGIYFTLTLFYFALVLSLFIYLIDKYGENNE